MSEVQEDKNIPLIKILSESNQSKIPNQITYKGQIYYLNEIIKNINELFYENNGIPISTNEITESLGIGRAEKFAQKVIFPHLINKGLVSYITKGRKHFFYPSAIIIISKRGTIADFTTGPYFKKNLQIISKKIIYNICEPSIRLFDLLETIEGNNNIEIINILVDFAKTQKKETSQKIPHDFLIKKISKSLLKRKIDEKTKESFFNIGNLTLPFILWYGTGIIGDEFTHDDISSEYIDDPLQQHPKELQFVIGKFIPKKIRNAKKQGQVFDNHLGYKLLNIIPKRELIAKQKNRKLQLHLIFTPTDFFMNVVTNLCIDELILEDTQLKTTSIREKYVNNPDLNNPAYLSNSVLANMFGVAIVAITEDNKILLQKRSPQVFIGTNRISLTTAEHMIRNIDEDEYGNPDIFITAQRCFKEEIGVDIKFEDINFLGFGIRLDNLLPQALGIVKLKLNSSELPIVKARDRWEGSNFFEDFSFKVLKKYFKETYLISATAKSAILLALINQYGFDYIEEQAKQIPSQMILSL